MYFIQNFLRTCRLHLTPCLRQTHTVNTDSLVTQALVVQAPLVLLLVCLLQLQEPQAQVLLVQLLLLVLMLLLRNPSKHNGELTLTSTTITGVVSCNLYH